MELSLPKVSTVELSAGGMSTGGIVPLKLDEVNVRWGKRPRGEMSEIRVCTPVTALARHSNAVTEVQTRASSTWLYLQYVLIAYKAHDSMRVRHLRNQHLLLLLSYFLDFVRLLLLLSMMSCITLQQEVK